MVNTVAAGAGASFEDKLVKAVVPHISESAEFGLLGDPSSP
jgi:hypothetical protein